jgi:hypothetical protein
MQGPNAEDSIRAGGGHVTRDREEAVGHRIGEPTVARQIRRAVVEQIHQPRPAKVSRMTLRWNDGMFQTIRMLSVWLRRGVNLIRRAAAFSPI